LAQRLVDVAMDHPPAHVCDETLQAAAGDGISQGSHDCASFPEATEIATITAARQPRTDRSPLGVAS
jgi:hypothetical protein